MAIVGCELIKSFNKHSGSNNQFIKMNVLGPEAVAGSRADYYQTAIDASDDEIQQLINLDDWRRLDIVVAGRTCQQNRFSCFFAREPGLDYTYSGVHSRNAPEFTDVIERICSQVELLIWQRDQVRVRFNFCLLNKYENGTDTIGWHSDDERSMVRNAPIASVSLGAPRFFDIWETRNHKNKVRVPLESKDLVVMWPPMQQYYQHSVPQQKKITTTRVNLTFRCIQ